MKFEHPAHAVRASAIFMQNDTASNDLRYIYIAYIKFISPMFGSKQKDTPSTQQ